MFPVTFRVFFVCLFVFAGLWGGVEWVGGYHKAKELGCLSPSLKIKEGPSPGVWVSVEKAT